MKLLKETVTKSCACALSIALCLGTATAQEAADAAASFTLMALTDSEQTTGRHYVVQRYADDVCTKVKKGSRLYRKKYAKDEQDFPDLELTPGELFIFQVDYSEKRRGSERSCSASIGFTPLANRSYKAVFAVSGQVSRCGIDLLDITDGELAVDPEVVPQTMCTRRGANGNGNGVPQHSRIDRL